MKSVSYGKRDSVPYLSRVIRYLISIPLIPVFAVIFVPVLFASDIAALLEKKSPAAKEVITKPTFTRVSEIPRLPVSLRQYEFLTDHPRLSMVLARIYDPSLDSYLMEVRPDGLIHVVDPAGLAGDMELIRSDRGERVYFVTGHFDFLKMRFKGHMVMIMSYAEQPGDTGVSVDSKTTSYIRINSSLAGFFARIVAFLFPKKVDDRIGRFTHAIRKVSFAVHEDPSEAYGRLVASGKIGQGELKEFAGMFLKKT